MKPTLLGPRAGYSTVEILLLIVLLAIVLATAWATLGKQAHADTVLTVTKTALSPADPDLSGVAPPEAAQVATVTYSQSGDTLTVLATSPYSPSASLAVALTAEPAAPVLPESDLIELSAASPLGPDASITFSGAVAVRLFALPDKWPLVGGRTAFASALTVGKYIAIGGDVSLQKASEDTTKLRLGACYWRADGDNEWSIYLRWPALGLW